MPSEQSGEQEKGDYDELLPERSGVENVAWYLGGAAASMFIIGFAREVGHPLPTVGLVLFGAVGMAGVMVWMVRL